MEWIKIFNSRQDGIAALGENQPRLLLLDGRRICLLARAGKFYATEERCPHNGESLTKGSVNYLGEIICPWHGYRFNIVTGRECEERCRDLITFPMKDTDEGVFIHL